MAKAAEPKIWDRHPWPAKGERSKNKLYASIGQALTHWERYEVSLALLFATFVSPFNSYAARRAYVAVRTFEGRADMLRAASSAYFETLPNTKLQENFKSVLKNAVNFSPRRNDIAHGVVDVFIPAKKKLMKGVFAKHEGKTYALYPSVASFKERDLGGVPSYCMICQHLNHFAQEFENSIGSAIELQKELGAIWNGEVAMRYKLIEHDQE